MLSHLQMTESWLADEVSGLSQAQLEFRTAPGTWSILEVLEHLVIAEPIYWREFEEAMKAPPGPRPPYPGDEPILWYGIDRTRREKAVPAEEAKGQLRDCSAGLAAFRRLRARMLAYVRTTKGDLRSHIVQRQGCDAYQWLLLISAHAQRHILQIREIKAHPRFPRRSPAAPQQ